MSLCNHCDIEEKMLVCCGRCPLDGRRARLQRAGREVHCCPYLEASGLCGIYDQRPVQCRMYVCERFERSRTWGEGNLEWLALLLAGDIREAE